MAVIPSAQRRLDLENLEKEVIALAQAVLDLEFAERLTSNSDWADLCKAYRQAAAERASTLDDFKKQLLTEPLAPDYAVALRERVMLLERDRVNAEDFVNFPARTAKELKKKRERLNDLKDQLRKMKEER